MLRNEKAKIGCSFCDQLAPATTLNLKNAIQEAATTGFWPSIVSIFLMY